MTRPAEHVLFKVEIMNEKIVGQALIEINAIFSDRRPPFVRRTPTRIERRQITLETLPAATDPRHSTASIP